MSETGERHRLVQWFSALGSALSGHRVDHSHPEAVELTGPCFPAWCVTFANSTWNGVGAPPPGPCGSHCAQRR